MAKQNNTNAKKTNDKTTLSLLINIIPIIIIAAIVPLIVYVQIVPVPADIRQFWTGSGEHIDFFSRSKALVFAGLSFVSFLMLIGSKLMNFGNSSPYLNLDNESPLRRFFYKNGRLMTERVMLIPMSIYTLLTILSALFSQHKNVSFIGFPDRYEGLWVLLGYVAVWLCIVSFVSDIKQINWILYAIIFSGIVMAIIGITQFAGHDFFQTDLGKALMVPDKYKAIRDGLNFAFGAKNIYSTLFNPNNVGSMMSMLSIMGLAFTILIKNIYAKAGFALFTALMLFSLLGSNSRGGFIGFGAGLIFLIIMLFIVYKLNIKFIGISAAIILLTGIIVIFGKGTFNNLNNLSLDSMLGGEVLETAQDAQTATMITGLYTEGKTAVINTDAGDLLITYVSDDNLAFSDKDGYPINFTRTGTAIQINDPRFAGFTVDNTKNEFKISLNHTLIFSCKNDEMLFSANGNILVKPLKDSPSIAFLDKYGHAGSSRFAIWSRSIPMIKDNIFIGKGPDTFAAYYPQTDYTAKIKYYSTPYMTVDKPHNQYLQIALNQGLIALLSFLAVIILYYYQSIKNIIKQKSIPPQGTEQSKLSSSFTAYNVAFGSALMAYLAAGLFNDSIVSVAPIFWIILGLGCALNIMVSDKTASKG